MTSVTAPGPSPVDAPPPSRAPHPALFLTLFIPFGAVPGFLTVALAYQLSKQGISTGDIAIVVALTYVAQIGKFLWAPLVDTLSTRKVWYTASALVCGGGLYFAGAATMSAHVSLGLLSACLTISNFASTFLAMSIESLMAASVPDTQRGRASGWAQAGNLGGQGIGGGFGLWLIQGAGLTAGVSGAVLGAVCVLCCLALFWVDDSKNLIKVDGHVEAADRLGLVANARAIVLDLWELLCSRIGILALFVCILPIGSGAAQNLYSAIADEWHASANVVALVNGAMGGVISALGCLVGGWACDRMDRKAAYCLFGFLLVLAAIGMALFPRTSVQFIVWTSLYNFVIGLCYAAYSAVVLEAVGRTAAATKFSFLSSLANAPIMLMTLVDGAANDRWGTRGMLLAEAACGVAGIAVFASVAGATKRRAPVPQLA
jgi:MFS transporter, PAT family, beta-lactamase induction signal transducer AmpG